MKDFHEGTRIIWTADPGSPKGMGPHGRIEVSGVADLHGKNPVRGYIVKLDKESSPRFIREGALELETPRKKPMTEKAETMTIDEAIENNEEHSKAHRNDAYRDYYNALKLSLEALKRCRHLRILYRPTGRNDEIFRLLPGETVDQRTANIGYGSSEALKKQRG